MSYTSAAKSHHAAQRSRRIFARDHGLADVSDQTLRALTRVLYLDAEVTDTTHPDDVWLELQARHVQRLDASIRRPKGILQRLAVRMGKRGARYFPQTAHLCEAHEGLDPRVIRNFMLLVGQEVTARSDRLRKWRGKGAVSLGFAVEDWLDRLDSVTGLWFQPDAFHKLFGYERNVVGLPAVGSGCEACILGVVGARPEVLVDLRAGMLARRERYRIRREPRLLRIVDAWLKRYEDVTVGTYRSQSEELAKEIGKAIDLVSQARQVEGVARGEGDHINGETRRRNRRALYRSNGAAQSQSSPLSDMLERPVSYRPLQEQQDRLARQYAALNIDEDNDSVYPASEAPFGNQQQNNQVLSGDREMHPGTEAWDWLSRRLARLKDHDRQTVISGVHPAFSEYGAFSSKSAVPSPLRRARADVGQARNNGDIQDGTKSLFTDMSAHTDVTLPTLDSIPGIPHKVLPGEWCYCTGAHDDVEEAELSDYEDEDEYEQYLPPRHKWKSQSRFESCSTPAVASSVYTPQGELGDGVVVGDRIVRGQGTELVVETEDGEVVEFGDPWAEILDMDGWHEEQ